MTAPRLEIDLDKIHHNTSTLVQRLATRGISVTGITKATLGSPEIANIFCRAGVSGLGDSRVENIERMRHAGQDATISLVRSPMPSQVRSVVLNADVSFNTELEVISLLSSAAGQARRNHGIVLMVELGDLREGILPCDFANFVSRTLRFPHLSLEGIGTNLACHHGVSPDVGKMAELSALVESMERSTGRKMAIVSGGNSANLQWALGSGKIGRINDLRLGESILLGRETLHRRPIDGLHTDAITLIAEVIESKVKPSKPWGTIAQTAFGEKKAPVTDRGSICQSIFAIGHQDTDPAGIQPPSGIMVLGASSDHLITESNRCLPLGSEITFQLNYSALLRAMTSPFISQNLTRVPPSNAPSGSVSNENLPPRISLK